MSHEHYRTCIDACNASADAAGHCAVACLFEPNRNDLARCIQLDMDCAEICRLAAAYMARGSELVGEVCAFCADACDACAEECERHPMDHCRRTAKACRETAQACRAIAGGRKKSTSVHPGRSATH